MTVETMEGRTLFSVTVTEGYYGFYDVTGDASADVIAITVDQDNQTFTLDDTTYYNVEYIFIDAGDGGDVVTVTANSLGFIGASVVGGGGDDQITVNFDGAVWGGDGADVIDLSDSFRGEVYGEAGDDLVTVHGGCYDAVIDGGAGNDILDASDNDDGVFLYGGYGDDVIYGSAYCDNIWGGNGADVIYGGAGNDVFYTVDGSEDYIDGGSGSDWVHGDATEGSVVSVEHGV
jgi:Ca2+-binding RTX toxin-like protein